MISANLILTIISGLVMFVFWLFAFIILYHLMRFGIGTQPKKFALIFLFGSVAFSMTAMTFFAQINVDSISQLFV